MPDADVDDDTLTLTRRANERTAAHSSISYAGLECNPTNRHRATADVAAVAAAVVIVVERIAPCIMY